MKTNELTGAALDWAVASVEKLPMDLLIWKDDFPVVQRTFLGHTDILRCEFSTNWAQGGPIIERAEIFLAKSILGGWRASIYLQDDHCVMGEGETPLVAAMRCYVESKLGEEVDLPGELA